jgi:hypothetical protein
MNVKDLNVGDVFRITDHPHVSFYEGRLYRKETHNMARPVEGERWRTLDLGEFREAGIEVVERADTAAIRRSGETLILKGGDVLLERQRPFRVYRCTPKEQYVEFVLSGTSFVDSVADALTADSALPFIILAGGPGLGRPSGSMVFAYRGRVYARATNQDIRGKGKRAYKRLAAIDGVKRLVIAGLLTVPDDGALFDIIQEQFGPM